MPEPCRENGAMGPARGLFSTATKINLAVLCVLLLVFTGLMINEFLTTITCMLVGSLFLTYLLLSPVSRIESLLCAVRWKNAQLPPSLARALAIVLVYLLFFGLLAVSIIRVAPPLLMQVKEFGRDLPGYMSELGEAAPARSPAVEPLNAWVEESVNRHVPRARTTVMPPLAPGVRLDELPNAPHLAPLEQALFANPHDRPGSPARKSRILAATYQLAAQKVMVNYKQYLAKLGGLILDVGATTLSSVIYALTLLVLVFYLLHDGKALKDGLVDLMPHAYEAPVDRFLERLHLQFYNTVRGQLFIAFVSGIAMYVLLWALGLKYPLLLGVFFGIASLLPIIGPWLGLIPITLILTFSGHPLDMGPVFLGTGVFYLVKTYWIWPRILPRHFDVHPILFILSLIGSLKLVGLWGILFSFPLASLLGVAAETLRARHATEDLLRERETLPG